MIEIFAPILLQRLTELLPAAVSETERRAHAVEVARRALALEIDRNLSVIRSCLGDPSKLSANDATLIRAVARRLDVAIAIALYTEWSLEFDFVARLDAKAKNALKSILTQKPLPGRSARRGVKELKASLLLDFIARKVPEMQILASMTEVPDFEPRRSLNWPKRINNLDQVMKIFLKVLRDQNLNRSHRLPTL